MKKINKNIFLKKLVWFHKPEIKKLNRTELIKIRNKPNQTKKTKPKKPIRKSIKPQKTI
jgi:hypothetical protein